MRGSPDGRYPSPVIGTRLPHLIGLATLVAASVACSAPRPERLTLEQRTVVDEERRIRYIVHENWLPMDATMKCILDGSFLSIHVYSLIGAQKQFVAGLPDSLDPQIDAWARHDYLVLNEKEIGATTIGGLPAREIRFETRSRNDDPPGQLFFWIVRNRTYLYVIRASFRPDALPDTPSEVRAILDSVAFLEPPEEPPPTEGTPTVVIP